MSSPDGQVSGMVGRAGRCGPFGAWCHPIDLHKGYHVVTRGQA